MRDIECISDYITDEISDTSKYAKHAVKEKESKPWLAEVFYSISLDEYKHMEMLHGAVVRLIKEYRESNGEPPSDMMALYDYLHKRHIESAEAAKRYQDMYRK